MVQTEPQLGFIGLGTMGQPMALNLVRSGVPLLVWNRSPEPCQSLAAAGALVAESAADVLARCGTIILMLSNSAASDVVLGRNSPAFRANVAGRTIISMSTLEPSSSQRLGLEIEAAGGQYVEAPVSGSREPAKAGQLVAMLAGKPEVIEVIRPILAPMIRESFTCGPVPGALRMKLAVNLFLITMVTGLVESAHFAQRAGLDLKQLAAIIEAGPMASDVARGKIGKLVSGDFSRQASISDVLKNSALVFDAAREVASASPLLDACLELYGETESLGLGDEDMIAVLRALERKAQTGQA